MKNKFKAFAAALMWLICSALPASAETKTSSFVNLRAGNYVRMGSYMGQPIIWRCLGEDENGMLLVSRDILCFKAYSDGSGRWDKSFLRLWLNSEDKTVEWGETAPDTQHTDGNAYSGEAGFLKGFSREELSAVKTVSIKSVINAGDKADAQTGTRAHIYNSGGQFAKSVQNYATAYAITTEDRVFCLNISQLETVMAHYPSEFISVPTASAVAQSGNIKNSDSGANGYYWLRDCIGNAEFPGAVRCVYPDGRVLFADSDDSSIGVRPAFYVDKRFPAARGKGYESSPYTMAETGVSAEVPRGSRDGSFQRATAYGSACSITEGDYLIMGKYNNADIVWRCVDVNENGPLMLSESILCFKSYDSSGKDQNKTRQSQGSSNWASSNIRYWLNSAEGEGDKQWPRGNAPTTEACRGYNGYSAEKGFLANFSVEERRNIKTAALKTVINPIDISAEAIGTEPMEVRRNASDTANFADAYRAVSYDFIFLLGIEEVSRVKSKFGGFLTANPTAEAVNSNEAPVASISSDISADWWMRDSDPLDGFPQNVRTVTADGWVHATYANNPTIGVRPAFYLNADAAGFTDGSGSRSDPYRVKSHIFGQWETVTEPGCALKGTRQRICAECGEIEEEDIPAVGHRFGKDEIVKKGFFGSKVSKRVCQNCGLVYTQSKLGYFPIICGIIVLAVIAAILVRKRKK